jgi:DNA adenine methylase
MKKNGYKYAPLSPLRYPGAKRWMSGYILRAITQNKLFPDLFIEPFAGGASVSLALLHFNLVERIALIDRDPLLAAFWHTVFFDTDWLIDQVEKTEVSVKKWEQLKKQEHKTIRQKAFACLFLNRTSFSGILAPNAGPIGGKSQRSKYKIDCRFNKFTIIKRILRVAQYRDRVEFVWNLHWRTALYKANKMQKRGKLPNKLLYYLDPPFYNKSAALYSYHFDHDDHLILRDFLFSLEHPWILSYDSHPEIISMYKDGGLKVCDVNLIYTTCHKGQRGIGKEVIFSNLPHMISEIKLGADKHAGNPKIMGSNFELDDSSFREKAVVSGL